MITESRIAIVGAGLAGLACARALQRHGRRVTVFEREASPDVRAQGGTLDLHADTGQAALRAVGLFDEFAALSRPEDERTLFLDPMTGAVLCDARPEPGYAPEIDRGQLRALLLKSLESGTVAWGSAVTGVTSEADGTARLTFADNSAGDFDLVIGADGAWSRIRPAVSDASPRYLGTTLIDIHIDDVDTRHPEIAAMVTGTLVAEHADLQLTAQRNSGGHIRVYVELNDAPDWYVAAGVDMADAEAVRAHLLARFAGWHDSLLNLIRCGTGEFVNRPLYELPVGHRWDHVPGITLLGDAAHLMIPAGIGANLALFDGVDLATALVEDIDLDRAVRAYEGRMFPRSAAAARTCAEFANSIAAGEPVDVDAFRRLINERVLRADAR